MKEKKKITVEEALKNVSASARRAAFRHNLPVAISKDGKGILLYSDGREEPITPEVLRKLCNTKDEELF
ncbi:hypothetical protein [Compostibacter hankyongensis]